MALACSGVTATGLGGGAELTTSGSPALEHAASIAASTTRTPSRRTMTFPFPEPMALVLQRCSEQRVDGRRNGEWGVGVMAAVLQRIGGPTIQCGKGFRGIEIV